MIDEHLTQETVSAGYYRMGSNLICLYCGKFFADGEIFPIGGRYFDAARAAEHHVHESHPDRLSELFSRCGRHLSLTDNQRELMRLFAAGLSDQEIARKQQVAVSTIRHQRFTFRERAKAARCFLAAWQIAEEGKDDRAPLIPIHKEATMVDKRYVLTEEENEKILKNVFESLDPLRLKVLSSKEKKKIASLNRIIEEFEAQREYTEKEVNAILKEIYPDFATLRRYLIEYGYMERKADCSIYWRK